MRQTRQRQRLQPNAPRTSKRSQKNPVAPKQYVANSLHAGDLKIDAIRKHPHMTGMYSHRLTGRKIIRYDLPIQFDPGLAGASEFLQQKTVPPENTGAKRLLKSYAQVDSRRGAQKSMSMN